MSRNLRLAVVVTLPALALFAGLALLPRALEPTPGARPAQRSRIDLDPTTLAATLSARGFLAPTEFKALVVAFEFDAQGQVVAERAFDYRGTALDSGDWNPASTVKLYSAIGALARVCKAGLPVASNVAFADPSGVHEDRVDQLVRAALIESDNLAHNRLVQLAGFDALNAALAGGFARTGIARPYDRAAWGRRGADPDLRNGPRIELSADARRVTLPAIRGHPASPCGGRSACTSLADLALALRRVMLHEVLPTADRLPLSSDAVSLLRGSLSARRGRGQRVADRLVAALPGAAAFHKPGFSRGWMSDVVWLHRAGSRHAWIVALAAHAGRSGLDDAADHIGALLADGTLTASDRTQPVRAGQATGLAPPGPPTDRASAHGMPGAVPSSMNPSSPRS